MKNVIISGAGLSGSLLGIFLARRGYSVDIFERRPDLRKVDISAGRSINLALSNRGIKALEKVGLADKILANAIPMRGRMMHAVDGELTFQPYGKAENEVINSVSRGGLNAMLMEAAEEAGVRIHFKQRCMGMSFRKKSVTFRDEENREVRTFENVPVLACDGSASAVRTAMQQVGRFNFHQEYLGHGYKELNIPPGPNGDFLMEKNALHIWPRGSYMLIALPNPDASFTCTLFLPFEGDPGFAQLTRDRDISAFFEREFPDALALMPNMLQDFNDNPTGQLVTIRCYPWRVEDTALLVGDSAHAIVPFYGQGMNCCFEDCSVFDDCLEIYGEDWNGLFDAFQQWRKPNTDAIAELALENFIEMRDQTADPVFLRKRQLELRLESAFPGQFLSKYSMVTFHQTPYAEALRKGRIQDAVLMSVAGRHETVEEIDLAAALAEVRKAISE